ncbi:1-acyl-sn-glycerol-3-phosphate acyltransferases [Gordonia malaquae]|uniref:1-acylglycerol-3-phosphate O-acyltransferase n=1 Tax=Gordonia malaquae NBRC 108250 TaxID=1223542 RepID=M3TDV9_GORML|nr:1-acyl-sn-glycerol-3-phosphate acyltransferase [Gordonia malaquae]GAC79616.1 1-acylglycerol-3-phosphate O-acyltransferase [Gordonia malaquae NBRC 108250]SED77413.1 1-acyl-sn-glycerol-3-phosphate acyltransferases [Gordonia malaquae]
MTNTTVNQWVPHSPCGAACVPETKRVSRLRSTARMTGFAFAAVVLLTVGLITVLVPRRARHGYWRGSARVCLRSMGVRLTVEDRRPDEARRIRGALIVANHVSFLDIVAMASVAPARFVAKHEVAQMAGFGIVAKAFGVLSHVRGDLRLLRPMIDKVTGILDRGRAVAVFPEGTTWCGAASGRFRPAFFQAAVDAGVPVLPMRLTYSESGRPTTIAGFIGDDTIGATFMRIVTAPELVVTLTVFDLQLPAPDRLELAKSVQRLVNPAVDLSDRLVPVDLVDTARPAPSPV